MRDSFFSRSLGVLSLAWQEALHRMVDILPQIVVAILILLFGWLVATLARFLLLTLLEILAIDKLVGKTPLAGMIKRAGIERTTSDILGALLFWLVVLFTLIFASEALALTQVAQALTVVTRYVPKIIASFLIIVFGMLLARFLQTFVVQTIGHTQRQYERLAGKIVHGVILVFVLIAALDQLDVELSLVTTNFMILLGVILSMVGIALAIGARPLMENILACQQIQSMLKVGDQIRIGTMHGKLTGFTATMIILQSEGREVFLPARLFLEQHYERHGS